MFYSSTVYLVQTGGPGLIHLSLSLSLISNAGRPMCAGSLLRLSEHLSPPAPNLTESFLKRTNGGEVRGPSATGASASKFVLFLITEIYRYRWKGWKCHLFDPTWSTVWWKGFFGNNEIVIFVVHKHILYCIIILVWEIFSATMSLVCQYFQDFHSMSPVTT